MKGAYKLIFTGELTEDELDDAYKFIYRVLIISLAISVVAILV